VDEAEVQKLRLLSDLQKDAVLKRVRVRVLAAHPGPLHAHTLTEHGCLAVSVAAGDGCPWVCIPPLSLSIYIFICLCLYICVLACAFGYVCVCVCSS
jgi:hypothetical protein